jgi:hypothetical protein
LNLNPLAQIKYRLKGFHQWVNSKRADPHAQARVDFENELSSIPCREGALVGGSILIDATWDNPNYWLRVRLLLAAIGTDGSRCEGVLGEFRVPEQRGTLQRMGVTRFHSLADSSKLSSFEVQADALLKEIEKETDILSWSLPCQIPGGLIYDYIVKRQNHAFVQLGDPRLRTWIAEMLQSAQAAREAIERESPGLIICSHSVGLCGVLAWVGLQAGVRVIMPHGAFGLCRFWSLEKPEHFFKFYERIPLAERETISNTKRGKLENLGEEKFQARVSGASSDVGAIYAYRKPDQTITRESLCKHFDWNPTKPIVGVFSSCWSDYPHLFGMDNFLNFHELIQATIRVASNKPDCNWLFKAHPCESWYDGVRMADLFQFDEYPHVRQSNLWWSGVDVLNAVDSVVTCHGTVGVEAAVLGKPVLMAERGWYDEADIAHRANSRSDYGQLLGEYWPSVDDLAAKQQNARLLAGVFWGRPDWQAGFLMSDDSRQWEIYQDGNQLIRGNMGVIDLEIDWIRNWYQSGHPYYHVYKMLGASEYAVD